MDLPGWNQWTIVHITFEFCSFARSWLVKYSVKYNLLWTICSCWFAYPFSSFSSLAFFAFFPRHFPCWPAFRQDFPHRICLNPEYKRNIEPWWKIALIQCIQQYGKKPFSSLGHLHTHTLNMCISRFSWQMSLHRHRQLEPFTDTHTQTYTAATIKHLMKYETSVSGAFFQPFTECVCS